VIVPRKREADAAHFIITGIAEKGAPKGRNGAFEITMTLDGQEVTS
jgi:hypothetical protein